MNPMSLSRKFAAVLCAIVLLSGCATQQAGNQRRYFWPPLPERPRIEWIKAYSSQLDFPKEGFSAFLSAIAGDEEPMRFSKPLDIRSNGKGQIYVTDVGYGTVLVYDLVKKQVRVMGGDEAAQFSKPVSLAIDDDGSIYVSEIDKGMVLVFDKNEKPLRAMKLSDTVQKIGGLAIDREKKRLLVTDARGHKVSVFTLDGKHLFSFGRRGENEGEFNFPIAITVNHKGEIIVGDAMNARIQIFDGEGKFLRAFGSRGDGPADFQLIKGVAVDSDDNIYVTEGKGHKLMVFSRQGDYLITIGGLYSILQTNKEAPGGFVIPQGIDIDATDRIYVVDQLNQRFQVFQYISDRFLKENPIPGVSVPQ
ncbi:6-bladed beta-propeller [Geobacter sp.]|uniref:6-bladed beta-propeller n=1 Tax=Geobacter sp. TaxID=46610 RepID=UPI00260263B4|nr:6-bladed beta-propeller [Geobacter sp.]